MYVVNMSLKESQTWFSHPKMSCNMSHHLFFQHIGFANLVITNSPSWVFHPIQVPIPICCITITRTHGFSSFCFASLPDLCGVPANRRLPAVRPGPEVSGAAAAQLLHPGCHVCLLQMGCGWEARRIEMMKWRCLLFVVCFLLLFLSSRMDYRPPSPPFWSKRRGSDLQDRHTIEATILSWFDTNDLEVRNPSSSILCEKRHV